MIRLHIIILLWLFSFVSIQTSAQELLGQARVDSLLEVLQGEITDTVRVDVLYELCKEYTSIDGNKAVEHGQEGTQLARKINLLSREGDCQLSIGLAYVRMDNFLTALEYYDSARKIYEEIDDKDGLADVLSNTGGVYAQIGNNEEALAYYAKTSKLRIELNDPKGLGVLYANMGIVYMQEEDYNSAHNYYNKALETFKTINDDFHIAIVYNAIGHAYIIEERYDDALRYLNKSLVINKKIGNVFRAVENSFNLADVYNKQKNYAAAIKHAQYVLDKGRETGNLSMLANSYGILAKANSKIGNYKNAFFALEDFILAQDTVSNMRSVERIQKLTIEAEYEKQQLADSIRNADEKRIAALKLNRQRLFTYSGIAVAIVLIVLLLFIVRERKKSDKLLLNILPEEVTKELKQRGATTAQHFDRVTVFFTDFVDFTTAGERLGSDALVGELHTCFKAFDEIISKYGIEKIKTIGDAYMAVCGLPTEDELHAEKVVKAATEIMDFMQARRTELGERTFEVRIGVHSGDVVAGIVGVKKFAYDIWGDTVNTAARMEQNSEAGKINISQTTYELVQDKFTCTYRGELEAKNKGKLKMYFVEV